MKIRDFYATQQALEHILGKHQVEWEEVDEIMSQGLPMERSYGGPERERRYMVEGTTSAGRRLRVIFGLEPPTTARIVTAYERRS